MHMTPDRTSRRRFLAISGATAATAIAGCSGEDGQNPGDGGNPQNGGQPSGDDDAADPDEELTLETSFLSREEFAQPGELFEDFEADDGWSVRSGTVEFDTEHYFDGSQSAHLSAADGENIVLERPLDDEDLTNRDFSFALYTPTPRSVAIYLEFEDVYGSRINHQLRRVTYRDNDVDWFRTAPGVFDMDIVPPEMDELARMRLVVLNNSEADVWIDDLRMHEKPDKGYVILSWDDGFRDFYTDAAEMHEEFGYRAVQAAVPGYSGDAYMSVEELQERQEAGDEIVMHGTHEPIHEYDEDDMETRLRNDKQWFINHGLQGADHIIYPHNSFNATSLALKNQYHYSGGCNQAGDVNTTSVAGFDPLVLPRTIAHDLDISKRAVDMAARGRNCTILNFHRWDAENTIDREAYDELLAYIDEQGDDIEVITMDDLWELRMNNH